VSAGLNKHVFEMANIRNHDSWVHAKTPELATEKAKKLVRMAVAKSVLLTPLFESQLPITQSALVVGGGIAGMTASLTLARQGFCVTLVEKNQNLGGNARQLNKTYLNEDIGAYVKQLIHTVEKNERISIFLGSGVKHVDGFVGNFNTTIVAEGFEKQISHGVAILAVGAKESKPDEYLYGTHNSVLTHLDLDAVLKKDETRIKKAENIVFIQCVGSRDTTHPYCSKVCCTHSIQSAIEIKRLNPEANIYIIYRDIRTYGKRELIYKQARDLGILFFRYDLDNKPVVSPNDGCVTIEFEDHILQRRVSVDADILCLASRIEARDNLDLSQAFKVVSDSDGWLLEAHQKLRPVDFATDGVFLCGMAHYPKPIDESIAQAKAAASRAVTTLAQDSISVGGIVSTVNPRFCSGCGACIKVCPYGAIEMNDEKNIVEINSALCKGCGACAATCPSEALVLDGFNNEQLYAQIKSAMTA
jgi:heterodisulfide reductase subunit A